MANELTAGYGGAAAPAEPKPNPVGLQPANKPAAGMTQHFGSAVDAAHAKYEKMKEARTQITAVIKNMGELTKLLDTVTTQDVVKASANMVAAGIPAIEMAKILADMPEQGAQLQSWVKHEYDLAVQGAQQVDFALKWSRHEMISAGLRSIIAHSAEAREQANLRQAVPAGNA